MATLQAQRTEAAQLAERLSLGCLERYADMSVDERAMLMDSLREANHRKEVLDQQIAWENRRTGWCWPTEPAWTN